MVCVAVTWVSFDSSTLWGETHCNKFYGGRRYQTFGMADGWATLWKYSCARNWNNPFKCGTLKVVRILLWRGCTRVFIRCFTAFGGEFPILGKYVINRRRRRREQWRVLMISKTIYKVHSNADLVSTWKLPVDPKSGRHQPV